MTWTFKELLDALQEPLGGAPPFVRSTIDVRALDDDGEQLVVDLDAGPLGGPIHRWRLTMASIRGDLTTMPLVSAAFTLRANLEEWWDTRNQYPDGIPGMTEHRLS